MTIKDSRKQLRLLQKSWAMTAKSITAKTDDATAQKEWAKLANLYKMFSIDAQQQAKKLAKPKNRK